MWPQHRNHIALALSLGAASGLACEEGAPLTGTRGELRASTPALEFGDVPLGQERTEELVIENAGDASLEVSDFSGLDAPYRVDAPELPVVLSPGTTVTIAVRFTPAELGAYDDTLEVAAAEDEALAISVRGQGVEALSVEPSEVDFGPVLAGASKTATVAVRNHLDEAIFIQVAGGEGRAERFGFEEPGLIGGDGLEVAARGRVEVAITYQPEAGVDRSDMATFELSACEAFGCRASLGLRGRGTLSALACAPEVDFGWLPVGTAETRVVSCTNAASEPITLESGALSGSSRFSLPDGFAERGTVLEGGATFETPVRFEAREADIGAPLSATLQVRSADAEGRALAMEEAALVARVGPPSIEVVPAELDYGRVAGGTTLTRPVQVFNRGRSVLSVTAVVVPDDMGLSVTEAPNAIPPGESETLRLAWTAQTDVDLDDVVTIESNDPARPSLELPVQGDAGPEGRCFYELDDETVRFGAVTAFHHHTSFMVFRNTGSTSCLVRTLPADDTGDFRWADDDQTFEVPAGDRQLVMLDFRPTGLGPRSTQLPWYVSSPLDSELALDVEGSGSSRRPFVHPAFQDFGYIPQACSTVTATLTIRNSTYSPIVVQDLSFTGDGAFEFVDPGFPLTVADESFEYVRIRYTPGEEDEAFGRYRFDLEGGDAIEGTLFAETGTATRVTETFGPDDDPNEKLDVLVQVDNETFPNEYTLDQIPIELESLRSTLDRMGIDYHIGHITTLGGRVDEGWPFPCPLEENETGMRPMDVRSGSCGFLHETVAPDGSVERFISDDSLPSPSAALDRMLLAPFSAWWRLGENVEKVFSPPWILHHNAGFRRPDAALLLVTISHSTGGRFGVPRSRSYLLSQFLEALHGRSVATRVRAISTDGSEFEDCVTRSPPDFPTEDFVSGYGWFTYPLAGGGISMCRTPPEPWGSIIADKFLPFHGHWRRIRLRQSGRDIAVSVGGSTLRGGDFDSGADWRIYPTTAPLPPIDSDTGEPLPWFESRTLPVTILEFSDEAQPGPTEEVRISYQPTCVP